MIDGFIWLIGCASAIGLVYMFTTNANPQTSQEEQPDEITPFIIEYEGEDYYKLESGGCSDCDFKHGYCPGSGSNCTDLPGHWEKL